jgi:hypothetical protein
VENPASPSQSFVNGSNIAVRKLQARKQGGGKIAGYQSQTKNAVRKRAERAAKQQHLQGVTTKQVDLDEDCWKGYKQVGMKKKGKKAVPNCVPVKEENNMRLNEFAPAQPDDNHGGDNGEKHIKWSDAVKHATHWFAQHGFQAKHAPGEDAIQYSKQLDSEDEQVWLMAMIGNHDDLIRFVFCSITNGEMDPPLPEYQGFVAMTAQGLNQALAKAQEAFGL